MNFGKGIGSNIIKICIGKAVVAVAMVHNVEFKRFEVKTLSKQCRFKSFFYKFPLIRGVDTKKFEIIQYSLLTTACGI